MQQHKQQNEDDFDTVNLFENVSRLACHELRTAKRQELRVIASQLREMFRTLSNELVLDRERSLALIAEYTGILTDFSSQINAVREGRLGQGLDPLAKTLEQGVEFLIGFFTVHEPVRETWCLDRTEIKGNLNKVWPTVRKIEDWFTRRGDSEEKLSEEELPEAA